MVNPPAQQGSPVYYTPTQLGACALLGGWPLAEVDRAVAIAMAESSGQANAVGPLASGSRGYGLMQVMYPMHQDLFRGGIESGYWIDGPTNMSMARAIYQSQGWGAWETYSNGMYRLFSGQGAAAKDTLDKAVARGGGNVTSVAQSLLQPDAGRISAAQQAWASAHGSSAAPATSGLLAPVAAGTPVTDTPPANHGATAPIVRFLEVLLGSVLVVVGLYKLTEPITTPIVKGVKTVTNLASKK